MTTLVPVLFQFVSPDDGSNIATIDIAPLTAHVPELGVSFGEIFPPEPLTDKWDNPGLLSIVSGARLRLVQFAGKRTFKEITMDEQELNENAQYADEKYAAQVFGSRRITVNDRTQVTFNMPVLEEKPAWVSEAEQRLDELKGFIEAGQAHPGCLLRNVSLELQVPVVVPGVEIPEVVEGEPAP